MGIDAATEKAAYASHMEHHPDASSTQSSDVEKHVVAEEAIAARVISRDEDVVTFKTWVVVWAMAFSYGACFWPVPFFSTIQSTVAVELGSTAGNGTWITSCYITCATIAFMICGANSDLFGRRWFLLGGCIFVFVGAIVGGTSHSIRQTIVAHCILGFGAGNCQMAAFAIPELLPNKWRHIGVVIADGIAFFCVIAGPVTSRVAANHHEAWRWGYWSVAICVALGFIVEFVWYYPPKHPRGIAWHEALKHLDWVGIILFTLATALFLTGIVYVQLIPASSPKVIALLCSGAGSLILFALWETFAPLHEPLTPTRLFTANKGRTLGAPFIVGAVVTMYYFGLNIVWGTMVSVFWGQQSKSHVYWLATVQGFGILAGGIALTLFGSKIKHWKWQMTATMVWTTFFGGLLAYITPERQAMGIAFAFLSAVSYAWAQYLSIAYIQFGAPQEELGIAGGLAGVSREAGGAIAVTVYATILVSVQSSWYGKHVVPAAEAAGATKAVAEAVAAAVPLGAEALAKIQGATPAIIEAAAGAFVGSFVQALKTVSLAGLGFGGLAIISSLFLEDIEHKMNDKIEIFLENDVEAHKNKFH